MSGEGGPAEDGWQHFHPLTPVLRGGVMITAVVGYLLSQQSGRIFGDNGEGDPTRGHLLQAGAIFVVILLAVTFASWISWRASLYRLGPATVELKRGIVTKQHRQVRYDRIQAVDITRPLLARVAGLSSVRVEAAGGRDSNIDLSYLPETRASQVREELLRRAAAAPERAGADGSGGEHPASGPGEVPIARIPAARVWLASALTVNTGFLIIGIPALVFALATRALYVLPWLGPMVLGALSQQAKRFSTWMNFRVDASPTAIRIRHGLTELRTTTVPLHRIQAVEISSPPLWRLVDWWRVEVNVAGVHHEPDERADGLIPVGTRAEVLSILAAMGPQWSLPELIEGMDADGASPHFVGAPESARILDPLSWKRIGYAVTPAALVSRGGWLGRRVQLVPHARVQSLTLDQGPLERRLGLANVHLHSTAGPVDPLVRHLSVQEATRLFNDEATRAALARRAEAGAGNPPRPPAPGGSPGALSSLAREPNEVGSDQRWTE